MEDTSSWIWFQDPNDGWVRVYSVDDEDHTMFSLPDGSITVIDDPNRLFIASPPPALITHVTHEADMVHKLRKMTEEGVRYEVVGETTVLSITSGTSQPSKFPEVVISRILSQVRFGLVSPILIPLGLSGSGKSSIIRDVRRAILPKSDTRTMICKILAAHFIEEVLTTASTKNSPYSSRCGQLTEYFFDSQGMVSGCTLSKYFLESCRVSDSSSKSDSNFVIFHIIYNHAKTKKLWNIESLPYRIVDNSPLVYRENYSFCHLDSQLQVLDITSFDRDSIYKTIISLVHLGSLEFVSYKTAVKLKDRNPLIAACKLLDIPAKSFEMYLIFGKPISSGLGSPFTVERASLHLNHFMAVLYEMVVGYLYKKCNDSTRGFTDNKKLAIFEMLGFRLQSKSMYIDLCFNFAVEALQDYYVTQTFNELYVNEGLIPNPIQFPDPYPCFMFISTVLQRLDIQEGQRKRSSVFHSNPTTRSAIFDVSHPLVNSEEFPNFIIRHTFGNVKYDFQDFELKGNDRIEPSFHEILLLSTNGFIQSLCKSALGEIDTLIAPIGTRFGTEIQQVHAKISAFSPHFILSIRATPVSLMQSTVFDGNHVLRQLRYFDLINHVSVRSKIPMSNMVLDKFVSRFRALAPKSLPVDISCHEICSHSGLSTDNWVLGATRIFFTIELESTLCQLSISMFNHAILEIQANLRAFQSVRMATLMSNLEKSIDDICEGRVRGEYIISLMNHVEDIQSTLQPGDQDWARLGQGLALIREVYTEQLRERLMHQAESIFVYPESCKFNHPPLMKHADDFVRVSKDRFEWIEVLRLHIQLSLRGLESGRKELRKLLTTLDNRQAILNKRHDVDIWGDGTTPFPEVGSQPVPGSGEVIDDDASDLQTVVPQVDEATVIKPNVQPKTFESTSDRVTRTILTLNPWFVLIRDRGGH